MMVRTQVQLSEDHARRLKQLAAEQGRSMAALIREGVAAVLARAGRPDEAERRRRALAVVGAFRSKRGDLSERHDEHLAQIYDS